MESRKAIGLAVILGAVVLFLVAFPLGAMGVPGAPLFALSGLVLNPVTLAVVLYLMFRRPQQQVVVHVQGAARVQVRCPACKILNDSGASFCLRCGGRLGQAA
ncbi:MAG: hypothetical protein ACYDBQ_05770 [Thermoplasmatota archaeon]